uniref:Uncharacterized protein n=1 Tax=Anguilla anguilla TaxID=7936 RepID=A0A0E9PI11_ANGAN
MLKYLLLRQCLLIVLFMKNNLQNVGLVLFECYTTKSVDT